MSDLFNNHEPNNVLKYFYEISQIPRGSGKEKAISDYLFQFSKNRDLEVYQDSYHNILIKKNCTPGFEDATTVILQGHMDMVWEKNKDTLHDFLTEGIKLKIIDDHIYAENTTLGADNGIAVAMILALLDSKDISHPKIEAVFTVEEETGLAGAMNLDTSKLEGKFLINLDSEDDTEILSSCAGGVRLHHKVPLQKVKRPVDFSCYNISITGLRGGHSGMDINLNRANANKLLARVLYSIKKEMKIHIIEISGGSKDNAIPREAEATILVDKTERENFSLIMRLAQRNLGGEYAISDPGIAINYNFVSDNCEKCYSKDTTDKIIHLMMILPNGVLSMSSEIDGLVESSINMAVIETDDKLLTITSSARSNVNSKQNYIINVCKSIADTVNIAFSSDSSYPGWAYDADSALRKHAVKSYQRLFGEDPNIVAIHAGVECGIFKEKIPRLDIISFGPNIYDVHTPQEHISISSIEKTWNFLLEILRTIE
ncbi:beta-Ala-His dipeptidase [Alkalibaculum sp. M08DMB]|uniref:Cytosol non-specific dipeptidase n=1 Tax=Alkalibaculum sporogenes TaxID=2655001 RepID=A0A6A7KD79_9FIRM|nr:aminoacyl-histidine dipeptidase [Alkalibaculum sporogenes]MPW27315.1 beta-Ala-His dipeptidase [Alkalibaculum sporogenes]